VDRRRGVAVEQGGQGQFQIGQMVANGAGIELAAPAGQGQAQRGPAGAHPLAGTVLAQFVQHQRFALLFQPARQRGGKVAVERVGLHHGVQGATRVGPQGEGLETFPAPAGERLAPQQHGAMFPGAQRRQRRQQAARQFAAGAEHVQPLAPYLPVQFGQKEHRALGAGEPGAVKQALRPQAGVDGVDVEGVQRGPARGAGQRHEGLLFERGPQRFTLGDPGAQRVARKWRAEGQAALPAVELAHLQQVGAQRHVGRVAGIGDVAVGLHRQGQAAAAKGARRLHPAHGTALHSSPLGPAWRT